jgi:hypothetical protein
MPTNQKAAAASQSPARPRTPSVKDFLAVLVPLAIGGAASVVLGVYGRLHIPTGIALNIPGFSGPQTLKVWMATLVAFFAVAQLVSALMMHGSHSASSPSLTAAVHRWSGRAAFLVSIPVAVHCLYALGFQATDARVLIHSLLGCVFYGAFTAKMLVLSRPGIAGWFIATLGGLVFSCVIGVTLTSALWFFVTFGVKF